MTEDDPVTITAEPQGREVIITRIFDAPRELVFKACTDPNLIPQWWGPKEFTTTVDVMELGLVEFDDMSSAELTEMNSPLKAYITPWQNPSV